MIERPYNVLFLCTGNSARSILAEALVRRWGGGKFIAFSAGSHPRGEVNYLALEFLRYMQLSTDGLRSKSWDEFTTPSAPHMDFVITVCDKAAGELCPAWPGQPMSAHWGIEDPAAAVGSSEHQWEAFRQAYISLEARIKIFASLPIGSLDRIKLQEQLDSLGNTRPS